MNEKTVDLELHIYEKTFYMMMTPAISTITFYNGSFVHVDKHLQLRVKDIVEANPWLDGRLYKVENDMVLRYEETCTFSTKYKVVHDSSFSLSLTYEQLFAKVTQFTVKDGQHCLKSSAKNLFLVTLVVTDPDRFAVVVSMSHVIGDGHTFYKLYKMLSPKESVETLIHSRELNFKALLDNATEGNDSADWVFSLGCTVGVIRQLLFGRKPQTTLCQLKGAWIEKQKQLHTGSNAFVSTNDILTSWFFKLCRCDVGIMAINFRNRIASLTDKHAGNYEALMAYQPADSSPNLIRKSLSLPIKRCVSGPLPGFVASCSSKIALVSTWVGLYYDVEFEGCQQSMHIPCVDGRSVPFQDIGVLFRPTKDTIGFLCFNRSFNAADLLAEEFKELIGEPLLTGGLHKNTSSLSSLFTSATIVVVAVAVTYYCLYAK